MPYTWDGMGRIFLLETFVFFFRFRFFTKNQKTQVAAGSPEVVKVVELMSCFDRNEEGLDVKFSLSGEGRTSWISLTLRILGMSWGVKTACFKAPGVSLGGSGVSIGGVRILREGYFFTLYHCKSIFNHHLEEYCFTFSRHFIADPSQHGRIFDFPVLC